MTDTAETCPCANVGCGRAIRWDGVQWRHTDNGRIECDLKATPLQPGYPMPHPRTVRRGI